VPTATAPGEIFIMAECLAPTAGARRGGGPHDQAILLHHGFPGRLSTGGNRLPFTPPEFPSAAYRFNIYHLMRAQPRCAVPLEVRRSDRTSS
jgi:hypothetical protein